MRHKHLATITAAFCVALVISNVIANKIVTLGPLAVSGASLIFPATYWLDDVLVEVYGYAVARRIIWRAAGLQLVAMAAIELAILMPGAIPGQSSTFKAALGLTVWIVAGSITAFAVGEFANSYVLARLKVRTGGRWLWTRTVASTAIGQALDSVIFTGIAFGIGSRIEGAPIPLGTVWHICWSIYVVKCAVEVVLTPVTYWIVGRLKRAEGVDFYDASTDFNPLAEVA